LKWSLRTQEMDLATFKVMGILNLTPDSFSDGGRYTELDRALARAEQMEQEGAHLLDLGAESTRPGATPVDPETEWRRLGPVLKALSGRVTLPISVDTRHGLTARRALDLGVELINDISMGQSEDLLQAVAESGAGYVLMHMRGTPEHMMALARYDTLIQEVRREMRSQYDRLLELGIRPEQVCLDPGFGFAKTPRQSVELLMHLEELVFAERPLLVGLSRKRMLRESVGGREELLEAASVSANLLARRHGALIFRVHDVAVTVQALQLDELLTKQGRQGEENRP